MEEKRWLKQEEMWHDTEIMLLVIKPRKMWLNSENNLDLADINGMFNGQF